MNLLQVTNLLNLVAQQSPDLEYYHYGWPSDLWTSYNATNNFNPNNSLGAAYPMLLFAPPSGNLSGVTSRGGQVRNEMTKPLYFADLLHRNNDGTANTRTQAEVHSNLIRIAVETLVNYQASGVGMRPDIANTTDVPFPYFFAEDTQDKIAILVVNVPTTFLHDCASWAFDGDDVDPPFSYPVPDDVDFENLDNYTP